MELYVTESLKRQWQYPCMHMLFCLQCNTSQCNTSLVIVGSAGAAEGSEKEHVATWNITSCNAEYDQVWVACTCLHNNIHVNMCCGMYSKLNYAIRIRAYCGIWTAETCWTRLCKHDAPLYAPHACYWRQKLAIMCSNYKPTTCIGKWGDPFLPCRCLRPVWGIRAAPWDDPRLWGWPSVLQQAGKLPVHLSGGYYSCSSCWWRHVMPG